MYRLSFDVLANSVRLAFSSMLVLYGIAKLVHYPFGEVREMWKPGLLTYTLMGYLVLFVALYEIGLGIVVAVRSLSPVILTVLCTALYIVVTTYGWIAVGQGKPCGCNGLVFGELPVGESQAKQGPKLIVRNTAFLAVVISTSFYRTPRDLYYASLSQMCFVLSCLPLLYLTGAYVRAVLRTYNPASAPIGNAAFHRRIRIGVRSKMMT